MAVCPRGGLSLWWSVLRVVFRYSGLSSGWSFVMVVCPQGGLSLWRCPQGGLLLLRSVLRVVFRYGGLSSGWSFLYGGLSSGWSFLYGGLSSGWSFLKGSTVQWTIIHSWRAHAEYLSMFPHHRHSDKRDCEDIMNYTLIALCVLQGKEQSLTVQT